MPMITITINSSMSVKPLRRLRISYFPVSEVVARGRGSTQPQPSRAPVGPTTESSGAMRVRSREQIEPCDVPERGNSITPANFLPLGVCAPGVADGNLVDPRPGTREARGHLRLKAESLGSEFRQQRARKLTAHGLVTRLHVGEVEIRQHVAVRRQHFVAHRVPVV